MSQKKNRTQQDIVSALLSRLFNKPTSYVTMGSVPNIKVKFTQMRPLYPVYDSESKEDIGSVQKGPLTTVIIIEDFSDDGKIESKA